MRGTTENVRQKVEIERFSVVSSRPFEVVVVAVPRQNFIRDEVRRDSR